MTTVELFKALAVEMNAHPERYKILGDADFSMALRLQREDGGESIVGLRFEGLECVDVTELVTDELASVDFWLAGPAATWQAMFDDIKANGRATGRCTVNSLALLAVDVRLDGADPMGIDKFSRFNQTLQEYLDGAARIAGLVGVG